MPGYDLPQTLMRRIADLERRLRAMETSPRATATSIGSGGINVRDGGGITVRDGGGLTITDGGGVSILGTGGLVVSGGGAVTVRDAGSMIIRNGQLALYSDDGTKMVFGIGKVFGGTQNIGFLVQRIDGSRVGSWYTQQNGSFDNWAWCSKDGQGIIADDGISGVNLAVPYIPIPMYPARYTDWPGTQSGAFETILNALMYRQNPRLTVQFGSTVDNPDTTGEYRVRIDGVQIGPTIQVGFEIHFDYIDGIFPVGGNTTGHVLTLEARRKTGTGNVRVGNVGAYGRQS